MAVANNIIISRYDMIYQDTWYECGKKKTTHIVI